jgi:hypothetical protein
MSSMFEGLRHVILRDEGSEGGLFQMLEPFDS